MDKIVVRKNPFYMTFLTKDWLVIESGTCVEQFDDEAQANAHRDKLIAECPKRDESGLSRVQELTNELRTTPKKEIKKRRQLKAEIKLIKAQEGQTKEKNKTKIVKKVETEKTPLAEAYDVLLPKKKTKGHYHPKRRGRCSCAEGDNRVK